jgi:UMF1 family MFS transporter
MVVIATIGFELAQSQYNSMLSDVAPAHMLGRVSGWAWAMGYFGGLICLIIALLGFIGIGDKGGFLRVSSDNSLNIRATCLLAAVWYFIFAIPLFLCVSDRTKNKIGSISIYKQTFRNLSQTIQSLKAKSSNIGWFLLSSALYRDGLNTLFTVGGLYAAGTLGMNFQEILIFAIGLNITSGIGAVAFSYLDDSYGAKKTIIISLTALIGLGVSIILVDDKMQFIVLALLLGLFIGPTQSSGRSMMARLSPPEITTELFGFYSMTGKAVSFIGPLGFAVLTHITDSQRWGMSIIIILWAIGLLLLLKVKEDKV